MSALPPRADYDLSAIAIEDSNLDPWDWNFKSALNDKIEYKLMSKDPLEYFDFKQRYLVKQVAPGEAAKSAQSSINNNSSSNDKKNNARQLLKQNAIHAYCA